MADLLDPRNWCRICGVHVAWVDLCPSCLDRAQHAEATVRMASMCRGDWPREPTR